MADGFGETLSMDNDRAIGDPLLSSEINLFLHSRPHQQHNSYAHTPPLSPSPSPTSRGLYPGCNKANVDASGPMPRAFSHSYNFRVNFLEIPSNFSTPSDVWTTTSFVGGSATIAFSLESFSAFSFSTNLLRSRSIRWRSRSKSSLFSFFDDSNFLTWLDFHDCRFALISPVVDSVAPPDFIRFHSSEKSKIRIYFALSQDNLVLVRKTNPISFENLPVDSFHREVLSILALPTSIGQFSTDSNQSFYHQFPSLATVANLLIHSLLSIVVSLIEIEMTSE